MKTIIIAFLTAVPSVLAFTVIMSALKNRRDHVALGVLHEPLDFDETNLDAPPSGSPGVYSLACRPRSSANRGEISHHTQDSANKREVTYANTPEKARLAADENSAPISAAQTTVQQNETI
jgi:hypothetical protein